MLHAYSLPISLDYLDMKSRLTIWYAQMWPKLEWSSKYTGNFYDIRDTIMILISACNRQKRCKRLWNFNFSLI
uniref:Ovule protein n=1 Tax=Ascaris lumbricoides TaxID=6252 RepID=A0A0M3IHQ6_ASCLU